VASVLATLVLLAGCELLPPDPATLLEEAVFAEPISEYTSGEAHVTFHGDATGELSLGFRSGGYYDVRGAEASFDALGSRWRLELWEEPGSPFVAILYHDSEPWAADSRDANCELTRTRADGASFAGTAECQGLRWLAQTDGSWPPVPGQAEFDATMSFHAER
jgi:hypothetical protein